MQLYASNTISPWPLSPFQESDLPPDVLLDASLVMRDGRRPRLGAVACGPASFYMAIKDAATGEDLLTLGVVEPVPGATYKMTSVDSVCQGWIVVGSGALAGYSNGALALEFDPGVMMWLEDTTDPTVVRLGFLDLDEVVATLDLNKPLEIHSSIGCLVKYNADIGGRPGGTVELLETTAQEMFLAGRNLRPPLVRSVGGATPDSSGNVNIFFEGDIKAVLDTNDKGKLVYARAAPCREYEPLASKVAHGKCASGERLPTATSPLAVIDVDIDEEGRWKLPLDAMIEKYIAEFKTGECCPE
jgi:hypothetical protein